MVCWQIFLCSSVLVSSAQVWCFCYRNGSCILPSVLRHEEVDIFYVLISQNKNCSLQVWFAVLVTMAMELNLKSSPRPETEMPGLTPELLS